MEKIWKIIDIINWGKAYFSEKGVDSPRLNIELILCKVLETDRIKLYTSYDLPLKQDELAKIKSMILRRAKREPLQYILGSTSFMGFEIMVNSSVLVPRPETEELCELIINNHREKQDLKILDIGTGSGCISIALAKFLPNSAVDAIDISDNTLATAKRNSEAHNLKNINFINKDFLKNCNYFGNYDVLVSNPPYISKKDFEGSLEKELMYEPGIALTDGEDGLRFYRAFADNFMNMLNSGGKFYLEIGFGQANDVIELFRRNYVTKVHKDFAGIERIVEGCVKIL